MSEQPKAPSRIATEPIITANSIIALIWAFIFTAISMGWITLTDGQVASWQNLIAFGVPILLTIFMTWWGRSRVKPMAKIQYEAAVTADSQ